MMRKVLISLILVFLFCFGIDAQAQNKMALTITPPLIKNNVNPGQVWKSYIKVVNNNPEAIDIYVELINFKAGNEAGTVELTPLSQEEVAGNEYLINNWVHIEKGPIAVPAFQSKDIPFIVDVPENIDPGDHHLAILVGTEPNNDNPQGSAIKISSKIGSLLLLNVGGDINESAIVREFSTDRGRYEKGNVDFKVRFQNTGNSILQPRGEIRIYDWQEKDQGAIMINHKTNTGNIFPGDTRSWQYNWDVPTGLLQMGRYKADMILTYGKKNAETVERTVYFWVIQLKPVVISISIILFIILFFIFLVRRSIRKAVLRTQEQIGAMTPQSVTRPRPKTLKKMTRKTHGPRTVVNLKEKSEKQIIRKK